jgi:hypothetical protein
MLKTLTLIGLPDTVNPTTYLFPMWAVSTKEYWIWKRVYEKLSK